MTHTLAHSLTRYACLKLRQELGQIQRCVALLSPADAWHRSNTHTNSIGNLLLHLNGNVGQWAVAGLGRTPTKRDRSAEFAAREGPAPAELYARLAATVAQACTVIAGLDAAALETRHSIQEYDVPGAVALMHVVEHFSFHTGQIVHMTKALHDVDLSLYDSAGHHLAADENWP